MAQSNKILIHLMSGQSITPLQALDLYGCFRLSARIQDLEAEGYKIKSKLIDLSNGKRVAQYQLTGSLTSGPQPEGRGASAVGADLFKFKADPLGRKVAV